MTDFADTLAMHDAQDFVDARILEEFIDEPACPMAPPAEVLGEERAPLLNACLMRRARSSQPVNFFAAAVAVWV